VKKRVVGVGSPGSTHVPALSLLRAKLDEEAIEMILVDFHRRCWDLVGEDPADYTEAWPLSRAEKMDVVPGCIRRTVPSLASISPCPLRYKAFPHRGRMPVQLQSSQGTG
jgi:hypothetical protein